MKFKRLTVLVALTLSAGVWAQTAKPVKPTLPDPLVQVVRKAVATNPEVQAAFNAFLASDAQRDIAKAGFLPQIDLSASVGTENRVTPVANFGTYELNSARLSLNQVLFDGFFTVNEVRRLGAAKLTRYYELLGAAETAALEAMRAYADVVRYRELVDAATQNYVEHKQSTVLVEERANSGVGRRVDVEQANGRLALAESNLLTELTNLHDVSARYLRVIGEKPAQSLPTLPEPFRIGALPASTAVLMQDGLKNNPSVLAAIQNARSNDISKSSASAAMLPRVDLQASASQGFNTNGSSGDSRTSNVSLAASYNLLRGGADLARIQQASRLTTQAQALQEKACRDARQTLSLAYSDVAALNEQLGYIDRHRLSSEKTREAYRQQFDIGQRTLLDLLDTQNEYFEATRSYINSRHDQANAQARTLAAMGTLVSSLGASRGDVPNSKDAGGDEPDPAQLCAGLETEVDTLDAIKARLAPPPPREKAPTSYVVLLPDADNVVGKVTVDGKGGKQTLDQAQQGVKADGGGQAFAVSPEQLNRDFGPVIAALPVAPEHFVLYFESGSEQMTADSKLLLLKILEKSRARAGLDVSVIGHTDSFGPDKLNEQLGFKRARYVLAQLKQIGVKTDAATVESHGEKSPAVPTADNVKEGRNRRVEVILR